MTEPTQMDKRPIRWMDRHHRMSSRCRSVNATTTMEGKGEASIERKSARGSRTRTQTLRLRREVGPVKRGMGSMRRKLDRVIPFHLPLRSRVAGSPMAVRECGYLSCRFLSFLQMLQEPLPFLIMCQKSLVLTRVLNWGLLQLIVNWAGNPPCLSQPNYSVG